jgi:outer membrane biosynthesis protein TonB
MLGSLLLHATIAAALLISWNFSRNLKEGSVVPVTIVSRAPDADLRPAEQAPVEQTAQAEEPVPAAPVQSTPPPAPQPKPTPTPPKPTPKAEPPPKPTPTPKVVPTPKPVPAPAPAKPAPPAKPEKSLDLDALSASISKMAKPSSAPAKPSSAPKGPARPETALQARATQGSGVSAMAMNGLVNQLRRHWHPNCEVEGARDVNIKVSFSIGLSGQVDPGSASANGSENSANPVVKAAAERAVRSVYEVGALKLISPEFYGQRVSATFPGNEACS